MNDARAASLNHNATCRKTKWHGIIATAREVSNAIRRVGDRSNLIVCQRVGGSVRAVRAIRNTQVFLMETWFVADVW
jgi:hypothetical protein